MLESHEATLCCVTSHCGPLALAPSQSFTVKWGFQRVNEGSREYMERKLGSGSTDRALEWVAHQPTLKTGVTAPPGTYFLPYKMTVAEG